MVYIRPTAVYKFYSFSTDPQRFCHIIMLLSTDYKPSNITLNRAIIPEKLICKNSHFPSMYTDFFNEKVGYFTVSGTASLNMKIFPNYPHPTAQNSMISHPVCQCHFFKTYPNVVKHSLHPLPYQPQSFFICTSCTSGSHNSLFVETLSLPIGQQLRLTQIKRADSFESTLFYLS